MQINHKNNVGIYNLDAFVAELLIIRAALKDYAEAEDKHPVDVKIANCLLETIEEVLA